MANLKGFKGLRYNSEKISQISDVIAPPYDVINKKQQEELLNQSPHNVVHIDFNDGVGDEKYSNAGKIFNEWLDENILIQEDKKLFILIFKNLHTNQSHIPDLDS